MQISRRRVLIVLHDMAATAAALIAALYVRFDVEGLQERWPWLRFFLAAFVVYSAFVYMFCRVHESKWRFASLPELGNIVRAATILAATLLVADYIAVSTQRFGQLFFGKISILLFWWLQILFLGASRVAYRYFRYTRTRRYAAGPGSAVTLVIGRTADAEVLLRAIESGAVKKIWPVGILSPSAADQGTVIRGISVLGAPEDLERTLDALAARGQKVVRLLLTRSGLAADAKPEAVLVTARRLGLIASQLPSLEEGVAPPPSLRLAPIQVEDLLLRPTVSIDYGRLENFIKGKSIAITGGGGSIGAELCNRVVDFGASRLLIIENSELALHSILEMLAAKGTDARIDGRIANIRDRDRIFQLFADFRPDLVFHAAALKHVPLLEKDWAEGVRTNVFGSINVADAAVAARCKGMVMVSTDKAIEPVSILGATKRFAEMYCQALDAELAARAQAGTLPTRIIAVRFGNVLGSNGSVVPKFKAQIEAGGPVTVTHPDMVRYFMTIREACDLVITSAAHALGAERSDVSIYVLNMGQPVKIVDLARRMIELSGLEPGRDIEIAFSGIRPGERLHEILFAREEPVAEIGIEGVVAAQPVYQSLDTMRGWVAALEQGVKQGQSAAVFAALQDSVPEFQRSVV
jgi:O-antigen biosynthesis protein WbqV